MQYTLQLKTPNGWRDTYEDFTGWSDDSLNIMHGAGHAAGIKWRNVGHVRIVDHAAKEVLLEFNERGFEVTPEEYGLH